MFAIRLGLCAAALVAAASATVSADVVNEWNDMYLAGIRTTTTWSPPQIAAAGAVMQTAVYDAVNSATRRGTSYRTYLPTTNADPRAAAVQASYVTLSNLFGSGVGNASFQTALDNKRTASLAALPSNSAVSNGLALGGTVGSQTLAWHQSTANLAPNNNYTPPTNAPGQWQQDYAGSTPGVGVGVEYTNARPWVMNSPGQFRPEQFSPINSAEYTTSFNRAKELGSAASTTRTADQSKIAWFWGNDRNGTFKPPGHYNLWARTVAETQPAVMGAEGSEERLFNNAKLLALVNLAQADAGIAAWDCKYRPDGQAIWRPITGIRNGDTDGNPDTVGDANWRPYSYDAPTGLPMYTPGFPGYISGHSTFGAAVGAILIATFGDNVTYDLATDDADYIFLNGGVNTRTYTSISQAILDNAASREFLGVHWDQDDNEGVNCGLAVGRYVFANAIPAPGAAGVFGLMGLALVRRRRRI